MTTIENTRPGWARILILVGVGLFLLALALSAYFVPELRLLHFLQALIYVVVVVLVLRDSPWGFGAGAVIATGWNCLNLFITHLFQRGLEQMADLARSGHVSQPDTMMVAVGGIGHFLLIIGCLGAFLGSSPTRRQWGQFLGGGLLVLVYFALIVVIAAPR
jgi:hypothetical protein